MPQLKKVVLAMGDRLIYRDTFDEALAELTGAPMPAKPAQAGVPPTPTAAANNANIPSLADRLRALRDQAEKLVQELDKLEKDAGKK
jgi:uncharacterized membrane protein (UPF0182 family)